MILDSFSLDYRGLQPGMAAYKIQKKIYLLTLKTKPVGNIVICLVELVPWMFSACA
jgi:hypothetical protein